MSPTEITTTAQPCQAKPFHHMTLVARIRILAYASKHPGERGGVRIVNLASRATPAELQASLKSPP